MKKAIYNTLTETEKVLVDETSREAMIELDEDQLLDLLTRVRRARTKYVKLYRRRGSAQVPESGGRGLAHPINQRNRDKAEVFERALARVSRRVQVVASQAADDLKAERLEAARSVSGSGPGTPGPGAAEIDAGEGPGRGVHQDHRRAQEGRFDQSRRRSPTGQTRRTMNSARLIGQQRGGGEQVEPQLFGQIAGDQLALHAVAHHVQQGRVRAQPAFAGRRRDDPAADPALAR